MGDCQSDCALYSKHHSGCLIAVGMRSLDDMSKMLSVSVQGGEQHMLDAEQRNFVQRLEAEIERKALIENGLKEDGEG